MISIFKKNIKRILKSLLTNPIFTIGYWIFCYELASLCMYGRVNNNIYFLIICIVFLISIIAITAIRIVKDKESDSKKPNPFQYISILIIVSITLFYGVEIYKSATNYGGKLAWTIERLKNEKSVKFEHNNIYKYGVEGIFEDINEKYTLPKKLYIESDFKLTFNSAGTITSLYTFVYGKNEVGKEESFLITYDKKKPQKLTLRLNGYAGAVYDDDKLVEPLIKTVNAIPVQLAVSKWHESEYGLVYFGKRNWGYNTEGIININEEGIEYPFEKVNFEKIGYTVSIYVPGKEKEIIPARYNLIGDSSWNTTPNQDSSKEKQQENNEEEQFFLSKEVGYQLNFVDKALGSTLYSLSKTVNGGETWEVVNEDPFIGLIGSVLGMTFINDKLGFIGAINPSGTSGDLYRTDDGGISFEKVMYSPHEVKLDSGQSISPYDSPSIPYEKDGIFNMLVGQGSDGDYNGNSSALYQSKDKGATWEYVKEVE
ncbi:glycosyl hydrolase [Solibacillus sp. CAU 1738]|uniref:WD40/YVTN/BNR-like repeat-containing protein n=1 Tax=Solibacillus sp. CAU 1738 TaxID=3140363 RepID=UPI0032619B01